MGEAVVGAPVSTARIHSGRILQSDEPAIGHGLLIFLLLLFIAGGFLFRVYQLGSYSLSEDELNKLYAVENYLARGISSSNGEHPMLMKGTMTLSIVIAEFWNDSNLVKSNGSLKVSTETALRLPGTLLGALTTLLIFIVASELFGSYVGLVAAGLWAFDPTGISFNRIAKEDSFFLFFFLLANTFWLRGQRAAEYMQPNAERYYWGTAAAFGAMLASKYLPHFVGISASYYYIFQRIPSAQWRLGKKRWGIFWLIAGFSFLICNLSILLPGTWHEMSQFAGERRIGHDSYEFMNQFYGNKMTLWLKGVPWYFYLVFMSIKLPVLVIGAFLVGFLLLFRKAIGDGRFFLLIWLLFWFLPFSVLGGKFTRYFTLVLPAIFIVAAIGINQIAKGLNEIIRRLWINSAPQLKSYIRLAVLAVFVVSPLLISFHVMPHYRLYVNFLGGGEARAGYYFPHDEFYDASMHEAISKVATSLRSNAYIASETPKVAKYYAHIDGRGDLSCISLSDHETLKQLSVGDCIIVARGRQYISNQAIVKALEANANPIATINLGNVPSVKIFILDTETLAAISKILNG